ncbi:MAG: D-amino-acid dehydrogenase [Gammaproteobacteria bacterium]|jgi:D-amino-acid dehydrogenase
MSDTVVIGGGLIGLATACVLQQRGHSVRLLEAQPAVAAVTSFANGGMLTPSMSDPWNSPGVGKHLFSSVFNPNSGMILDPKAIPGMTGWGLNFLRNSAPKRHREATLDVFRLATYSIDEMHKLTAELGLDYPIRKTGSLKIFRSKAAISVPMSASKLLAPLGLEYRHVGVEGAVELVPQLVESRDKIVDALYYPNDASCDAHAFSKSLALAFIKLGGQLDTGVEVDSLLIEHGKVVGVKTSLETIRTSQVVVAAGNNSAALLNPFSKAIGRRFSTRPVKGYSLTFDTQGKIDIPQMPVVDDALHVAVSPIGDKLRIAGFAEFTGYNTVPHPQRIARLSEQLEQLFPSLAAQVKGVEHMAWACLRPMTSDCRPVIGPTLLPGLSVNFGHGHLGLTKAVGSAQICADLINGKTPAINAQPFAAT